MTRSVECGIQAEAWDGAVYTCVRTSRHDGRHRDKDGVEWQSGCDAQERTLPGRPKCTRHEGHSMPHRHGKHEWSS